MRLTGNINNIKQKRDSEHKDVAIEINKIEYVTYKKDGKYHQPFDFVYELETPLIITGDRLAKKDTKHLEEGELEFTVYDVEDDTYVLNPDKQLAVTTAYDYDLDVNLLTFVNYTVVISNEAFQQLKSEIAKAKRQHKGKGKRS
jgi:hypothetical protein